MKRTIILLTALAALIISTPMFAAGSKSTNLDVTASVAANCTITTSAVAFGAYDPVVTNASTDLNGTGTVTVACTKNTGATVDLGTGSAPNWNGTTRRMSGGADFLTYALYKDSSRSQVWGIGLASGTTASYTALTKDTVDLTVYGKVQSGQDVAVGSYTDTIVATINY